MKFLYYMFVMNKNYEIIYDFKEEDDDDISA